MAKRGAAGSGGQRGGSDPAAGPRDAEAAGAARHVRGAERKGFLLRLPPPMLAELKRWASQDLRSLNAQIEYLLADALRRRKR